MQSPDRASPTWTADGVGTDRHDSTRRASASLSSLRDRSSNTTAKAIDLIKVEYREPKGRVTQSARRKATAEKFWKTVSKETSEHFAKSKEKQILQRSIDRVAEKTRNAILQQLMLEHSREGQATSSIVPEESSGSIQATFYRLNESGAMQIVEWVRKGKIVQLTVPDNPDWESFATFEDETARQLISSGGVLPS